MLGGGRGEGMGPRCMSGGHFNVPVKVPELPPSPPGGHEVSSYAPTCLSAMLFQINGTTAFLS